MNKVTCAGGFVVDGSKILLIKLDSDKYAVPKGHVEQDESFEQTAIREVEEETGVKSEIQDFLGEYTRQSEEDNGAVVEKNIKIYVMRQVGFTNKEHDENSEWVNIHDALDKMRFSQEAAFIKKLLD